MRRNGPAAGDGPRDAAAAGHATGHAGLFVFVFGLMRGEDV